jgi:tetratricopeptide (TPR) repeat protein
LAAAGETSAALERHARAMLALFERSHTRQWTLSTQQALELYLGDVDNLRAALDWSAGPEGNDELLVALAGASSWIWKFATLHLEGLNRFIEVRERIGPATPPQIEGRFQMGLAALGHNQSVPAADMARAIDRAIACYRKLDDRQELYLALAMQARYFTAVGDVASAERVLAEALALFDPAWPAGLRSPALTARAFIMIGRDRLDEAQAAWQEQLEVDESIGDRRLAVVSLNNLIDSVFAQGKVAEAIRRGRELVAMVRRERFSGYESFALGNLSAALTADGQLDEALEVAREGAPLLRQQGAIAAFLVHFALLAARRGRLADAARALGCEEAVTVARGYERQRNEGRAHRELNSLLKERMPAAERARLADEGARLSVDAAVQLALSA